MHEVEIRSIADGEVGKGIVGYNPIRAEIEEHTSELQSHHDLVCRLLLEKKKNHKKKNPKKKKKGHHTQSKSVHIPNQQCYQPQDITDVHTPRY